ncbi:endonuclease/exonuclease/phosphatase family protein [Breznakiellaceae bacterium SP9]
MSSKRRKKKRSILPTLSIFMAVLVVSVLAIHTCRTEQFPPVQETPGTEQLSQSDRVRIASFNIQVFGQSKMAKPEVLAILTDIVARFDLTAIQEVRSANTAPVEQFMKLLPQKYRYVLGPREGRSSSKEQYWVIYDADKFTVRDYAAWDDPDDIYERNPMGVYFATRGSFDFILIDNHIQPSSAKAEIEALPQAAAYFSNRWHESDVLMVGDFNADGGYFNENTLTATFSAADYHIVLTNDYDTTVAAGDNTYDRFIITKSAREDFTGDFGVLRFDEEHDFSKLTIEPRHVSDHYPIWADFYLERDTD